MRDFVVRGVACPTWFPGSLCLAIQDGGDSDVGLPKERSWERGCSQAQVERHWVTQWKGALRDKPNNGCVGDHM